MGIKNINTLIKSSCERALINVTIKSLAGGRIAIDAPLVFYTNMAIATKEYVKKMADLLADLDMEKIIKHCVRSCVEFHLFWMNSKISPVWLKDGDVVVEKLETRKKRSKARKDARKRIEELKEILSDQDVMSRKKRDEEELRKLMSNYFVINEETLEALYGALTGLGIPVITCPGEAEAYGVSLNRAGLVQGLWTSDTDCYALGGINMYTGFGPRNSDGERTVCSVHIPYILEDLKFTQEQVRDLCIMSGSDFNDNIPNIGVARSFKFIKDHGSIEEFEKKTKKDCDILNYERSRELLTPPDCELEHESKELYHDREAFKSGGEEVSLMYDLEDQHSKLDFLLRYKINVSTFDPESHPIRKIRIVVRKAKGKKEKEGKVKEKIKEGKVKERKLS